MNLLKTATVFKKRFMKNTMNAVRMHAYGGPEVLKYDEVPRPQAKAGELLIKVHAAGVNPVDWKIRDGLLKEMVEHELPLIPGWDFSGVVEEIGEGVKGYQKGDEVFGRPEIGRDGTYAEYVVVRETELSYKPASVDHVHAAAIPLAALTAWQSLFGAARLKTGQRVLIHAAAGGVGHFAVQLAKWRGAYVIGAASAKNQDFLRELGADDAIDYESTRFDEVLHNIDVVFDTIGGDTQNRSWKVMKKDGILVSIVEPPSRRQAEKYGVRQTFVFVQTSSMQLSDLADLVDSRELRAVVENVFPLSQAAQAQEFSKAGHTRGKIVLRVV